MNRTSKLVWLVVAVIVILLIIILGGNSKAPVTSGETIKIGFVAPLSGDGASYGQGEVNATKIALEEINSNGGVLGRSLEVIYEDGMCNGKDAATAAQKLVKVDKVKIILGGACSGETLAMIPITEQAKVLLFSAFSSNPQISEMGDFVFRNMFSDLSLAHGMANLAFENGNKIAVLSENTDYGIGVRDNIIKRLKELNAEVVSNETYNQGDSDFRTQLIKIKSSNPDAIILNPQASSGGLVARQAKELGINVPYIGGGTFSGGDTMTSGGSALNGLKFVDAPGLSKKNPKAQSFLTKYLSQYPKSQNDWEIGARYDSVYIIANAIESCKTVDTECIKDYLYSMDEYDGVIGKYTFDENGDPAGLRTYAIKQIVDADKQEVIEIEE